jgi:hypothetical protein
MGDPAVLNLVGAAQVGPHTPSVEAIAVRVWLADHRIIMSHRRPATAEEVEQMARCGSTRPEDVLESFVASVEGDDDALRPLLVVSRERNPAPGGADVVCLYTTEHATDRLERLCAQAVSELRGVARKDARP